MVMGIRKTVFGFQGTCLVVDGVGELSMSSMQLKTKKDTRTSNTHSTVSNIHFASVTTRKNNSSSAASPPTPSSHDVVNLPRPSTRMNKIPRSSDRIVLFDVAYEMEGCDGGRMGGRMLRRGMRIMFLIGWLVVMVMRMMRKGGAWVCGRWGIGRLRWYVEFW